MIAAAAHAHGVFLQGAQARHGLARAGHARAIRRHGPRDRCGGGGDAAQVAQEVQRHALGRQHGAGAALDARDLRARLQHAAVRARHAEADRRIQRAERQPRQVQPGQHALLARHQARFRLGVGGHDGIRRQVSRATQVLEQRGAHHRLQHYVRQRRNGQAVGRCEGFSIYAHNEYFESKGTPDRVPLMLDMSIIFVKPRAALWTAAACCPRWLVPVARRGETGTAWPACRRCPRPCRRSLDQILLLDQPPEILLVQPSPRQRLHGLLQLQQGELGRHQLEHDGPVLDLGAQPRDAGGQDATMVMTHGLAGQGLAPDRPRRAASGTRPASNSSS